MISLFFESPAHPPRISTANIQTRIFFIIIIEASTISSGIKPVFTSYLHTLCLATLLFELNRSVFDLEIISEGIF